MDYTLGVERITFVFPLNIERLDQFQEEEESCFLLLQHSWRCKTSLLIVAILFWAPKILGRLVQPKAFAHKHQNEINRFLHIKVVIQ
jgi:hypothetical protein